MFLSVKDVFLVCETFFIVSDVFMFILVSWLIGEIACCSTEFIAVLP